jgi:hypothetical protein
VGAGIAGRVGGGADDDDDTYDSAGRLVLSLTVLVGAS